MVAVTESDFVRQAQAGSEVAQEIEGQLWRARLALGSMQLRRGRLVVEHQLKKAPVVAVTESDFVRQAQAGSEVGQEIEGRLTRARLALGSMQLWMGRQIVEHQSKKAPVVAVTESDSVKQTSFGSEVALRFEPQVTTARRKAVWQMARGSG